MTVSRSEVRILLQEDGYRKARLILQCLAIACGLMLTFDSIQLMKKYFVSCEPLVVFSLDMKRLCTVAQVVLTFVLANKTLSLIRRFKKSVQF